MRILFTGVVFLTIISFFQSTAAQVRLKENFLRHTSNSLIDHSVLGKVDGYSSSETLKVLAVRVEFQEDNLATTTGNGRFDLATDSKYRIDRPPHNRTYFEHQLLALGNYFKRVSNNKVILSGHVLPLAENSAYQMPQNMVYYSGQENETLKKQRWAELLRDAFVAASSEVQFEQYDVFIVFHAGVGSDFAFDFDPTPYDIQSVYLDFASLKETLGKDDPNYKGIAVSANFFIRQGIILPETQNQEGQDLALLGTMTLLMGSHLGMPSLFDTETGQPGIGRWGLMDQGSYNFQGLVPAEPDAWSKVFMGWEEPVALNNLTLPNDLRIASSRTVSAPRMYKIPINAQEYYLLENRQRDPNRDGVTFGRDEFGNRVQIDSTGRVVAEKSFQVLTSIDEYDFGLPGSGILIWHIDERVIREKLASGTINNDRLRRGVDLVECDGAQDIGYSYTILDAAYGTEAGDFFDPFWAGNLSHKVVNDDAATVEFSPTSIPSTKSNGGGYTGIWISNFSARDTIMTCSVLNNALLVPGFPQYSSSDVVPGMLVLPTEPAILVVARKNGDILAWNSDGSPLIPSDRTLERMELGKPVSYPYALFTQTKNPVQLAPAGTDLDGDGNLEIIVVDEMGELSIWSLEDRDGDQLADLMYSAKSPHTPSSGPMVFTSHWSDKTSIALGCANGSIVVWYIEAGSLKMTSVQTGQTFPITGLAVYPEDGTDFVAARSDGSFDHLKLDASGQIVVAWTIQNYFPSWAQFQAGSMVVQPLVGDFDGKGRLDILLWSSIGYLVLVPNSGFPQFFQGSPQSLPAFSDANEDGLLELLTSDGVHLHAMQFPFIPAYNFPARLINGVAADDTPSMLSAPVWWDREGAQQAQIFCADAKGLIHGLNGKGQTNPLFPISAGSPLLTHLVLANLAGETDRALDFAAVTSDGFLQVWRTGYAFPLQRGWNQYGGNAARTFMLPGDQKWISSGIDLLPQKYAYCYPNPSENGRTIIRYRLGEAVDRVDITISDLAGDRVAHFSNGGRTPGDHEVIWHVGKVPSGAYIARIEAETANRSSIQFVKIAVVN